MPIIKPERVDIHNIYIVLYQRVSNQFEKSHKYWLNLS